MTCFGPLLLVAGKSHEIVSIQEALDRATKEGLDLLEVG
jgi:translation initiation factor IF-3